MTIDRTPDRYPGEALDSAMMLARLDCEEGEIAASVTTNFPLDNAAATQLARDAITAVQAERAEG